MEYYEFELQFLENLVTKYITSKENFFDRELVEYITSHASLVNQIDLNINKKEHKKDWEWSFHDKFTHMDLCHYTSVYALQSILENQVILMSQFKDMNDHREGKLLIESFEESLNESNAFCFKKILQHHRVEKVKQVLNSLLEESFSFSFSLSSDDNSQWERYGDKGSGVCLVSNISLLDPTFGLLKKHSTVSPKLSPVEYVDPDKFKRNLIVSLRYYYENSKKDELLDNIQTIACRFKHYSFSSEKEMRIFFIPTDLLEKASTELIYTADVLTRKGIEKKLAVNLFKLNELDNERTEQSFLGRVFSKIIIGPRANLSEAELTNYLKALGITDIKIEKSKSTLK